MKILILASNPRKDLSLDREIRDLRAAIEKAREAKDFQVEDALAVRVSDLQDLLFEHRPQIVHFCGHGSGQQGLVFEDKDDGERWVPTDALSELFRLFSSDVKCVILNACYSEQQASHIVNHIDYVIGMNQAIQDAAAIAFSRGFYRALGHGCSVELAYDFGCNAIQLEISGSSEGSRSVSNEVQRKVEMANVVSTVDIPEHLKPVLKRKLSISQNPINYKQDLKQSISTTEEEKTQLDVAQALIMGEGHRRTKLKIGCMVSIFGIAAILSVGGTWGTFNISTNSDDPTPSSDALLVEPDGFDIASGRPVAEGQWSFIQQDHTFTPMPDGRVLTRELSDGSWRLWNYDPSNTADILPGAPVAQGQWGSIKKERILIPMPDGRVLDWAPSDGSWRLWNYDPSNNADILPGAPVAQGQWTSIQQGHMLIPMPDGRVLDWVSSDGSWRLWNYDPSNTADILPGTPVAQGQWTSIRQGRMLTPMPDGRVLDWVPSDGSWRLWNYSY